MLWNLRPTARQLTDFDLETDRCESFMLQFYNQRNFLMTVPRGEQYP